MSGDINCEICESVLPKNSLTCDVCGESLKYTFERLNGYSNSQEKENLDPKTKMDNHNSSERNKQIVDVDMEMENMLEKEQKEKNDSSIINVEKDGNIEVGLDKWKCPHCEVLNENQYLTCIVCMGTRPKEWQCKKCSLLNDKSKEKCEACVVENEKYSSTINNNTNSDDGFIDLSQGNINGRIKQMGEQEEWECKNCSFVNKKLKEKCEACGVENENYSNTINDGGTSDLSQGNINGRIKQTGEREEWECKKCSFVNKKLKDKCEACGVENENAVKSFSKLAIDYMSYFWSTHDMSQGNIGGRTNQKEEWEELEVDKNTNSSEMNHSNRTALVQEDLNMHQQNGHNRNNIYPILNPMVCQVCFRNEAFSEEVCLLCLNFKWICPYKLCQKANYRAGDPYCRHCGIERFPNKIIGAPIRQAFGGTIRFVWVCHGCTQINDYGLMNCPHCKTWRINDFIWCKYCGHGNKSYEHCESLRKCENCHWVL